MYPAQTTDLYKRLGLDRNATIEEIKKAYRKLVLQWHPDKHQQKSENDIKLAKEQFVAVSEAFEVLSDSNKRAKYDSDNVITSFRHQERQTAKTKSREPNFSGIYNFYNDFFEKYNVNYNDKFKKEGKGSRKPSTLEDVIYNAIR